ncbi:hypothetical protein YC2023_082637 [Brassica napus]
MDLRTNPFEEGGNDVPHSTDQYIEPAQHGVQDVLNISTEVHVFHHAGQTDRAVYWTIPHTSGKELWLGPWSDERSDRSGACLSRPTSQAKADGQTRINLGRANSDSNHSFSLLVRLARTACTGDCADDLASLFNPIMDFSFGYFSKARILELSEDVGHVRTQLARSERLAAFAERPAALADRPAHVLILSTLDTASSDESRQKSSKEKSPRKTVSQSPFKYSLNNFDEFVSVQEQLDIRCKDHIKTTRDVADPKRRLLQFDVQEFCDNFEKGMMKVLKDISKNQKKSTSTRAPVAEPSLFISKKSKGKSETHVEELKDFSDSLPTFDEYDEEPIESLMTCENKCDLPSLEPEFVTDIEHAIVELTILQTEHPSSLVLSPQVFEEEPLDLPHQGPRLDTRISFDEDQDPIFDEEDEPGPVFDEGATNITSIAMESHLCFDPGTTHAPLSFELQEHCEQSDFLNSQPDMFVNISSLDVIRFGLEKALVHSPVTHGSGDGITDVPQSTDQYIEPAQHGVQDVLNISTEVHVFHRAGQTDRAVYWTVPHTSGKELWLEPWSDGRSDRTGAYLSRPTSQAKADGQPRINLGRANSDSDHSFSLLARLARTACAGDCADDLASLFDPIMDFSFGYFSKARILKLSEDVGHVRTQLVLSERPAAFAERPTALADCPAHVLILSALDTASSDESRQEPNIHLDYHIQVNIPQNRWTCESYQATTRDPSFGGLVSHIKHQLKSGISEAFRNFRATLQSTSSQSGVHIQTRSSRVLMSGLQRKSSKEKSPRQTVSQYPFKYSLNNFDEFVSVQEQLDIRCKDHIKTTRDVADPKRRLLQFDVQEFCDNFEKGMMKVLKDISKNQKKSTSTRAPVAEPSLFISKKSKGKSETHVEELKDFSDSLPTFDEYDEEPIESLMTCENKCDLPSLEPEFVTDIEHAIVELTILQTEHPSSLVLSPQVFEEEPLDLPHQGPRLDTRISFDEDQDPIFDEEDEPGPVFDEGATNITSIAMESHLCFDPGTTHAPLSFELQEHCEQSDFLNSQPDMFVNISSLDVIRFGLEKEMHVLKMNTIVAYLDKILSEREVQLLRNESIDRAQQPEI